MDYDRIGQELLRALRGSRSQTALSRRLGYSTNVIYTWEAGRRSPTLRDLWSVARCVAVRPEDALKRFLTVVPRELGRLKPDTVDGVAALLRELRGDQPLQGLAASTGYSRHALSRWFAGRAEPTLPQALALIDAASFRALDFVACLVDPPALPSAAEAWRTLCARRKIAFELPWSHGVLRALELADYRALRAHRRGWIAERIGITRDEETACLQALVDAGLVRIVDGRYTDAPVTVDTRLGPDAGRRAMKAHWAQVGLDRLGAGSPGLFSYNVCGVSRSDLARLQELHGAYFNQLRAIVAASEPVECVVVANVQLFELGSSPS